MSSMLRNLVARAPRTARRLQFRHSLSTNLPRRVNQSTETQPLARFSRRFLSTNKYSEQAASAASAATKTEGGSGLPWWGEWISYVSAIAVGGAAYFTTDQAIGDIDQIGLRIKNQLAITEDEVKEWVKSNRGNNFRGAALENFSLQAALVKYAPDTNIKLGCFSGFPSIDNNIAMAALAVAFVFVLPIPGIRRLPRLPREIVYGVVGIILLLVFDSREYCFSIHEPSSHNACFLLGADNDVCWP